MPRSRHHLAVTEARSGCGRTAARQEDHARAPTRGVCTGHRCRRDRLALRPESSAPAVDGHPCSTALASTAATGSTHDRRRMADARPHRRPAGAARLGPFPDVGSLCGRPARHPDPGPGPRVAGAERLLQLGRAVRGRAVRRRGGDVPDGRHRHDHRPRRGAPVHGAGSEPAHHAHHRRGKRDHQQHAHRRDARARRRGSGPLREARRLEAVHGRLQRVHPGWRGHPHRHVQQPDHRGAGVHHLRREP